MPVVRRRREPEPTTGIRQEIIDYLRAPRRSYVIDYYLSDDGAQPHDGTPPLMTALEAGDAVELSIWELPERFRPRPPVGQYVLSAADEIVPVPAPSSRPEGLTADELAEKYGRRR